MAAKKKGNSTKPNQTVDVSTETDINKSGNTENKTFPVVGIGASAGGLKAFESFFSAMPGDVDPGMAFVLVQHLAPDHKSILTDLVRRYTRMKVFEVEDGMRVEPNCAYIIPPNRDMAFLNGTLQLLEPSAPRGQRLPIDFFFRSLAQDQHERAICIVLSGTGSDGTLGVRAIKSESGMVMAQNPESTEFDGMPRSAMETGLVDYVLHPSEMPAQLIAYATYAFGQKPGPAPLMAAKEKDAFKKIFILLRARTGHDFSHYKQNTITRRVERRMAVQQINRLDNYVSCLQHTPDEVDSLFRDLLIGVTNFFRDPEAFHVFEEQIIPSLFKAKPVGSIIRIWVPGCSTGEEAYSVAILFQERIDALRQSYKIQIFATDIDSRAIDAARSGRYPASIASDITPERLSRFFTQEANGGEYRINKTIRDILIFSEQDLIKDPPFSKLDLISCRNLLIYMGGELQKKIIPLFHYALNPAGFLFLGTSETVGEFMDLFSVMDRKSKLYRRKEDLYNTQRPIIGRYLPDLTYKNPALKQIEKISGENKPPLRELTEQALLQYFDPVGVLINERGDILFLHGRSGLYLEPSPGEVGINNILKMAREGLRQDLTIALHKAVSHKKNIHNSGLRVKTNGDFTSVNLTVMPVDQEILSPAFPPLYLVILEKIPGINMNHPETMAPSMVNDDGDHADRDERIEALRRELKAKEEYLQSANEEMETSNEELKSSNEEMQSINEELQSTNEELETSKEELQSVNEELATVNAELQQKVHDLSCANNDMNNLLAGTGIGTIFIDHQLRILRFTPAVAQVINLIPTDVGRPVGHIVSNLVGYDNLVADVNSVLSTLVPKELDVRARAGSWFSLRIRPYRTLENVIEGAVITFIDITEIKRAREEVQVSETKHRFLFETITQGVVYHDNQGRIIGANPAAERLWGLSLDAMHSLDSANAHWPTIHEDGSDFPGKTHPARTALKTGKPVYDVVMGIRLPKKDTLTWIRINAVPQFKQGEDKPYQVYSIFDEITGDQRPMQPA
ncbi:MAG: PAS domain-containing protein [Proteobacteria bacterium]|nr:PAS domain-containing protein [Pseudomonadota bacterium]